MVASKGKSGNGGVNKSAAIRETLAEHPKAGPKEVVALLADKGIKVTPTLVYYIKSKTNQAKRKQKRERVAETSRKTGSTNPVELILKVKALSREAGGIQSLKQLVDALAE
jgi:hypothetical protein